MNISNKDILHHILDWSPVPQSLMGCNLLQNLFLLSNNKNRSNPNLLTSWCNFVFCHIVCRILCQWQYLWLIFSYCSSTQVFHSLGTAEALKHSFRTWRIICLVLWLDMLYCIVFLHWLSSVKYSCKVLTCELDVLELKYPYVPQKLRLDIREIRSLMPVYCPSPS